MSSTAYNQKVDGAAAFTGSAPTSVLDTVFPDLDDFDALDWFQARHTAQYLNHTGDPTELVIELIANNTTIYTLQFGAVGSDDEPRDVYVCWNIECQSGGTALITCEAWMSTAGVEIERGEGPALRPRATVWRDQPFVEPVVLDIKATLDSTDLVDHIYTPDATRVHKVEPVLSSGAGTGSAVTSVNGDTGDVVLTAADVDALADTLPAIACANLGFLGVNYEARPDTPERVIYVGAPQPTSSNTPVGASFIDGYDLWIKLP